METYDDRTKRLSSRFYFFGDDRRQHKKVLNTFRKTRDIIWASWYTQSKKSDENRKKITNKENR